MCSVYVPILFLVFKKNMKNALDKLWYLTLSNHVSNGRYYFLEIIEV